MAQQSTVRVLVQSHLKYILGPPRRLPKSTSECLGPKMSLLAARLISRLCSICFGECLHRGETLKYCVWPRTPAVVNSLDTTTFALFQLWLPLAAFPKHQILFRALFLRAPAARMAGVELTPSNNGIACFTTADQTVINNFKNSFHELFQ